MCQCVSSNANDIRERDSSQLRCCELSCCSHVWFVYMCDFVERNEHKLKLGEHMSLCKWRVIQPIYIYIVYISREREVDFMTIFHAKYIFNDTDAIRNITKNISSVVVYFIKDIFALAVSFGASVNKSNNFSYFLAQFFFLFFQSNLIAF